MTIVTEKELDVKEKQISKTLCWSAGGQICFINGFAWGVDTEPNTICLGQEEKVRKAIANPKLRSFDPAINQIMELEREIQEGKNAQPAVKVRPGSSVRSRPTRTFKRRTANIRQVNARKRLPIH